MDKSSWGTIENSNYWRPEIFKFFGDSIYSISKIFVFNF